MSTTNRFSDLVHPELSLGNYLPSAPLGSPILRYIYSQIFTFGIYLIKLLIRPPTSLSSSTIRIPTLDKSSSFDIYHCRPKTNIDALLLPGLIWIHGGGLISGSPYLEVSVIHRWAEPHPARLEDGAVVLAPAYGFAPAHPAPASGDDCFATWLYMIKHAEELGIDKEKIVIAGGSAGGGLAALLTQRINDYCSENPSYPRPVLQLLVYPMMDDRTVSRIDAERAKGYINQSHYPLWGPECNRYGWKSYLGGNVADGSNVPARRKDLGGLPPTWIGVGSLDLFHEEDVEYARRLKEAGVEVTIEVVKGGWHGFDGLCRGTGVVEAFEASQVLSMRKALQ